MGRGLAQGAQDSRSVHCPVRDGRAQRASCVQVRSWNLCRGVLGQHSACGVSQLPPALWLLFPWSPTTNLTASRAAKKASSEHTPPPGTIELAAALPAFSAAALFCGALQQRGLSRVTCCGQACNAPEWQAREGGKQYDERPGTAGSRLENGGGERRCVGGHKVQRGRQCWKKLGGA